MKGMTGSKKIVLGLGSNDGDRIHHLREAIHQLRSSTTRDQFKVIQISPIYESEALLPENAPESWNQPFLNINILCEINISIHELLNYTQSIENSMGRLKLQRWAPRIIDIDILTLEEERIDDPDLKIPHPNLMNRPFAMLPLADLTPHWRSPRLGPGHETTIAEVISPWLRMPPDQIPFKTHRSEFCLAELVGIVNLTPDSFSDGGRYVEPSRALHQAQLLIDQGASVVDFGAESTRPGAQTLDPSEEWARLEPVLRPLCSTQSLNKSRVKFSVDTRNAETAKKAIELGVTWINDVSGLDDPKMRNVIADADVDLVIMHHTTLPPTREAILPDTEPPIDLILKWGEQRILDLCQQGLSRKRIIFDPGIGFGKNASQTWEILRSIKKLQELGTRIMVGHSRKSFLNSITALPYSDRDIETVSLTLTLASKGIDYLRVHHVEHNRRALKTWVQVDGQVNREG